MSDTRSPPPTKRGISFSMSVVLPLPDQPANPKIFTLRFYLNGDSHHFSSSRGAAAGAARAGGAAEAVLAEGDAPLERGFEIEVEEAERPAAAVGRGELEHLVEVAVVDAPVVADADQAAAHDALGGRRVEGGEQLLHVRLELPGLLQVQAEAVDGHVGDGVEPVELEPELRPELTPVVGLERRLRRRQVRADR